MILITFIETMSLNKTAEVVFSERLVHVLEAQLQNVDLVVIDISGQAGFIIVWYSVANNSLPGNIQFCFEGSTVSPY
jgi:hypothetical protein